jgi:hypothetical protein
VVAVIDEEKQAVPISVVALRAESYSADGQMIVVSLRTKYSTAERKYYIPVECFNDLIVDLRRLNTSAISEVPAPAAGKNESDMPVAAE